MGILISPLVNLPLATTQGGTGVTTSTGSGNNVLSASPTLTGTLNVTGAGSTTATHSTTIKNSSTTTLFDINDHGDVGINGANTSGNGLDIFAPSGVSSYGLRLQNTNTNGHDWRISSISNGSGHGTDGSLIFFDLNNYSGGTTGVQMIIDNAGLVGIGTAAPTYNLDLVGTMRTTSYIYMKNFLNIAGTGSGSFTLQAAAAAGNVTWTMPTGGSTDFSATGGTSQFLKQASAGAAITVAQPASTDLSDVTSWTDYSGTSTIVGWSSFTTKVLLYKKIGDSLFVWFNFRGTSNSTSVTFTLPNVANANIGVSAYINGTQATDNGTIQTTFPVGSMTASSSTIQFWKDTPTNNWTASGTKTLVGQIIVPL